MTTTNTTTNNIKFSTVKTKGGYDYVINIRLNDECKNGHNDFSITGDIYTAGKRGDRNNQGGGAIGDTIAKKFPEFAIFNDLHLCDAKGAPMYAESNGFYWLKEGDDARTKNYLRINGEELEVLKQAEDKEYFTYLLMNLNIPARWEQEAKTAIAKLEELTGEVFNDDSSRYQFTPLSVEKLAEIDKRINEGYYTPAAIGERVEAKKQAIIQKQFDKIAADRDKSVQKAEFEYQVKHAVLSAGLTLKNFIYYNHSNRGEFNWLSYEKEVTQAQLDSFLAQVDYTKLPEGITFGFSTRK